MDPRPYHFEYRRPRLNNPTYQSVSLYQSIYQMNNAQKYGKQVDASPQRNPWLYRREKKVNESRDLGKDEKSKGNNEASMFNPIKRSHSSNAVDQNQGKIGAGRYGDSSNLSNYGNNLMKSTAVIMDQNKVYENQQKKFNIISYYPRQIAPNLKQFPRLTLQDKIYEKGPHYNSQRQNRSLSVREAMILNQQVRN